MNRKASPIGSYPANWKLVSFETVAELKHGYQFRNYDFINDGIKVFKITQIKNNRSIDLSSCDFIEASRLSNFDRVVIKKGDILMALTGATIGKTARYNSNEIALQNYRVGNFIPLDENVLSKDYFYYFLISEYTFQQILSNLTQSAQENVGKEDIHKMYIFLPPLPEQKRIAEVLSSLDDKIDLLHRQNKTLEALAETLFSQWFVEEGWETKTLYDSIHITGGGTPKTGIEEYWRGDIKWLSAKDVTSNHKSFISHTEKSITNRGLQASSATILEKYSTIVSARGTVGKYCLLSEPMAFSQSNYGITPKYEGCYFFTYLLLAHCVDELKSASYGSVFDTITTNTFKEILIDLPDEETIRCFENDITPYFRKIELNTSQANTLVTLRDSLLPKLLSGDITLLNHES